MTQPAGAVAAARRDSPVAPVMPLPAHGASFAALPATVERALAGTGGGLPLAGLERRWERVLLVLVDGLGWRGVERHGDHPFLRRVRDDGVLHPLTTQFPSTTTAHITTVHTGLPVGQHGLYEWNVLEPALGRIVRPLQFALDVHGEPGSLAATGLRPQDLVPGPTFHERLAERAGVRTTVHHPAAFGDSPYDHAAAAGATLCPHDGVAAGLAAAAAALREAEGPAFAYVYDEQVDTAGHRHGPASAQFDALARDRLDLLEQLVGQLRDTLLLVCADHGQEAVDPARVDLLDELWPALTGLLERGADGRPLGPAGSARDLFLHVRPDVVPEVVDGLRARLGGRAEVQPTADLVAEGVFGHAGPRLLERLAPVCVLPAPGRMAWMGAWPSVERVFRGHHGGLTPQEAHTFVAALGT